MKILTLASLIAVLFIGCPPKPPRVGCDLQIKKEVMPRPLVNGREATVTVTVTNVVGRPGTVCPGPTTVTDLVPEGMTLVSASGPGGWFCAGSDCTYPLSISSGSSVSVSYILNVAAPPNAFIQPGTTIQNCATVTNASDTNQANNECCVTVPVVGQMSGYNVPQANLMDWWPLDETSGTVVNNIINPHPHSDLHNGGAQAALGAGGPTPLTGKVGGALSFDGANAYVAVRDDSGTLSFGGPTDNFSIDAWIKVAPEDKSGLRPIVDKRVQMGNRVWGYAFFLSSGRLGFQLANGAADNSNCDSGPPSPTSSCTNYISNVDIADGGWRHVAVTVQRQGKAQVDLYVNGSPTFTGVTRAGNATNNAALLIGRGYPLAIPSYFKGAIDELKMFSRALTPDEIKANFAAESGGECEPIATQCCEFELRLFNNLPNTVNKIRIVPVDPTKIIHIRHEDAQEELEDDPEEPDPTEFTLQQVGSSYEITHISGFIPAHSSEMIDEEFIVRVSANTSIRVEWVDANGQVLRSEQIALKCDDPAWVKEDYPWEGNTTTLSGAQFDEVLFAGAERVECDPDQAARLAAACSITHSITDCNELVLSAQGSFSSNAQYSWRISDSQGATTADGKSIPFTLTGSGKQTITVVLTVMDFDSSGKWVEAAVCTKKIPYCIPPPGDIDFESSDPEKFCVNKTKLAGYNVTFTPTDPSCPVSSYTWDFGDGPPQTISGSFSVIPQAFHTYPPALTRKVYSPKLEVTYANDCGVQVAQHTVTVDPECQPKFKAEYEMCPVDSVNQNILVTCTNQSNEFCSPTRYFWDFGIGTGFLQNQSLTVGNVYTGVGPGTPIKITHNMINDPACPAPGKSTTCEFSPNPIPNIVNVLPCDDGKVWFSTSCPYNVRWSGISGEKLHKMSEKQFRLDDLSNGKDYTIVGECYNEQSCGADSVVRAKCVQRQAFRVETKFCKKREKHRIDKQIGQFMFRMKYKFKAKFQGENENQDRALLVARTKLRVKECVKIFGKLRCRWIAAIPNRIVAGFEGTFRTKETGPNRCRGEVSTATNFPSCSASSASPTCDVRTGVKAKKRTADTYLIHRDDAVKSIHEITIGSTVWRVELKKPANTCAVQ